ncbi:hypothetical protein JXA63_03205 [Candidatus Woesebacteria bacterium]|nr:hypothetical protein [Candidatus Woesebacteria bacterium]
MLSRKKKYLQIALNSTLSEARGIISKLPPNDRIILEAGTPLLKHYGADGIRKIHSWWQQRLFGLQDRSTNQPQNFGELVKIIKDTRIHDSVPSPVSSEKLLNTPYVVADYKAMDRGSTEVEIASSSGASAITVLGQAPTETIDVLIEECNKNNLDSIIDMMNVDKPYNVLRKLKKLPEVVMLHRGVDETELGNKPFPIHMINKIKGAFDVKVAIGGGDTIREVQSAIFNGVDIVMVWKEFYHTKDNTSEIAEEFLKQIK